MPRSFRGLRPSITVSALESSRWFMAGVRSVERSSGGRQAKTGNLLALYILQLGVPAGNRKLAYRDRLSESGRW
jgi:hypothetical protein